MVPTATEKRCKGCKQHKPLDDSYRLRSAPDAVRIAGLLVYLQGRA